MERLLKQTPQLPQKRTFPIQQRKPASFAGGLILMLIGVAVTAIGLISALSSDPPYATPTPFVAAEDVVLTGQKPDEGPSSGPYLLVGLLLSVGGIVLLKKQGFSGALAIDSNGIRVQDKPSYQFQWSEVRRVTLGKGPRFSASDALRAQGRIKEPINMAYAKVALGAAKLAHDSWWFDFEVEPQGKSYIIYGAFFPKAQHREVKHWIQKAVQNNLRPEQIVKS